MKLINIFFHLWQINHDALQQQEANWVLRGSNEYTVILTKAPDVLSQPFCKVHCPNVIYTKFNQNWMKTRRSTIVLLVNIEHKTTNDENRRSRIFGSCDLIKQQLIYHTNWETTLSDLSKDIPYLINLNWYRVKPIWWPSLGNAIPYRCQLGKLTLYPSLSISGFVQFLLTVSLLHSYRDPVNNTTKLELETQGVWDGHSK